MSNGDDHKASRLFSIDDSKRISPKTAASTASQSRWKAAGFSRDSIDCFVEGEYKTDGSRRAALAIPLKRFIEVDARARMILNFLCHDRLEQARLVEFLTKE
jgi:hypothetical protein